MRCSWRGEHASRFEVLGDEDSQSSMEVSRRQARWMPLVRVLQRLAINGHGEGTKSLCGRVFLARLDLMKERAPAPHTVGLSIRPGMRSHGRPGLDDLAAEAGDAEHRRANLDLKRNRTMSEAENGDS